MAPPRKIDKISVFFQFFPAHAKMAWDGPKWGREVIFLTNPDLADILGDTDFDFGPVLGNSKSFDWSACVKSAGLLALKRYKLRKDSALVFFRV